MKKKDHIYHIEYSMGRSLEKKVPKWGFIIKATSEQSAILIGEEKYLDWLTEDMVNYCYINAGLRYSPYHYLVSIDYKLLT